MDIQEQMWESERDGMSEEKNIYPMYTTYNTTHENIKMLWYTYIHMYASVDDAFEYMVLHTLLISSGSGVNSVSHGVVVCISLWFLSHKQKNILKVAHAIFFVSKISLKMPIIVDFLN